MCKVVSQIVWVQVGARVLRGNEPVPPSVWPPRAPSLPTMGVRLGLFRAQQAQKFILGLKGVMPTLKWIAKIYLMECHHIFLLSAHKWICSYHLIIVLSTILNSVLSWAHWCLGLNGCVFPKAGLVEGMCQSVWMALASDREGGPTASFDTNRVMGGHVYWLLEQLLKVGPWRSLAWYEGFSWTIVGDGLDSKCC